MARTDKAALSAREQAYRDLKDLILTGRLRPAERLSESRLAERLGVSRTPLREALLRLEDEGLVTGQRNVGYSVKDMNLREIADLLAVREALDVCAAELACESASDQDLEQVAAIIAEMRTLAAQVDPDPASAARALDLGLDIHHVIADSTYNDALVRMIRTVYQQLRMALMVEMMWVDPGNIGLEEHEAIADALIARDKKRVAVAARAHVRSSLDNLMKIRRVQERRRDTRLSGLSYAPWEA